MGSNPHSKGIHLSRYQNFQKKELNTLTKKRISVIIILKKNDQKINIYYNKQPLIFKRVRPFGSKPNAQFCALVVL